MVVVGGSVSSTHFTILSWPLFQSFLHQSFNLCLLGEDTLEKVKDEVKFAQHSGNIFAVVHIGELKSITCGMD